MKLLHRAAALFTCVLLTAPATAENAPTRLQERLGLTASQTRDVANQLASAQRLLRRRDRELEIALGSLRRERGNVAALRGRANVTRAELDTARLREQAAALLVDNLVQERRAVDRQFASFYDAVFKTVQDAAASGSPELRSALLAYESGDRDQAIATLTTFLERDQSASRIIGARTLALLAVERIEQGGLDVGPGVRLLEAALRVDPSFHAGWVVLRIYYARIGQMALAGQALSRAGETAVTPDERLAMLAATADMAGFQDRPETGRLWDEAVAAFRARAMSPSADALSKASYLDTVETAASYAVNVSNELAKAERLLDDAEAFSRTLPDSPFLADRRVTFASLRAKIAFERSDFAGALAFADAALSIARRLVARNPVDENAHSAVVEALSMRGNALASQNNLAAANDAFAEAFEIARRKLEQDPTDVMNQFRLENVLAAWGQIPQERQAEIWRILRTYIEGFAANRSLMDPERALIAISRQMTD